MQIRIERAGFDDETLFIEVTEIIRGIKCKHVYTVEISDNVDIVRVIDSGIFEAQKALEESIKRKLSEF